MRRIAFGIITLLILAGVTPRLAQAAAVAGVSAPAFEAIGADGELYRLSDYAGKMVVLEWVNYQCPFVRKFYDSGKMQSLQKFYTEQDVVWLSIVSSAPGKQGHLTLETAPAAVADEGGHATAVLLDEAGIIGKTYGAKTTPHMYVINSEGVLVYSGAIDSNASTKTSDIAGAENYVVKALQSLMAGEDVETTLTQSYGCSVKYGES